jgi:hypothetical protein
MKKQPLTDLEMFELLQAAYPGKFPDDIDPDGAWDAAMEFADNLHGFDELADLLGRVAMLTMPMTTAITGELVHCLGQVDILEGKANMLAAVKRMAHNAKVSGGGAFPPSA